MNAKEYLESKGYEFPDKDFWMEDYVTDHKFKDLVQLMEDYAQQKLNIDSVVRPEVESAKAGVLLGNEVLVKAVSVGFCNHQYEFNSAGYQSCLWCGKSISG